MPKKMYHVQMHDLWTKAGKPKVSNISYDTRISRNTILRYTTPGGAIIHQLQIPVVILAEYFGVAWHEAVTIVEVDDETEKAPAPARPELVKALEPA